MEQAEITSYDLLRPKLISKEDFNIIRFKKIQFGVFGDEHFRNGTDFISSCSNIAPAYRLIGVQEDGKIFQTKRPVIIREFGRNDAETGQCVEITLNGRFATIKNVD